MPQYCIVCNKDLALDPIAEPPLCGYHTQASRVLGGLDKLDTRIIQLIPGERRTFQEIAASVVVDRTTNSEPFQTLERLLVEPTSFTMHQTEGRDPSWYSVTDDVHRTLLGVHDRLVAEGWRPFSAENLDRSVFDMVILHFSDRILRYGYKLAPSVEEFYLWEITSSRRVDRELAWKVREGLISSPSSATTSPEKKRKLFGIF